MMSKCLYSKYEEEIIIRVFQLKNSEIKKNNNNNNKTLILKKLIFGSYACIIKLGPSAEFPLSCFRIFGSKMKKIRKDRIFIWQLITYSENN